LGAAYIIGLWQANFQHMIHKKIMLSQMLILIDKFLMLRTNAKEEHIVALKKEIIDFAASHEVRLERL